jgi:hypothetical protein
MFWLNQNNLIESIFWYFSENLGLFRFVSKQFCLFQLIVFSRYRFEIPKQTEIFCFWFHKTQPKQILFRVVSFEPKYLFVCFEDTLSVQYLFGEERLGEGAQGLRLRVLHGKNLSWHVPITSEDRNIIYRISLPTIKRICILEEALAFLLSFY